MAKSITFSISADDGENSIELNNEDISFEIESFFLKKNHRKNGRFLYSRRRNICG